MAAEEPLMAEGQQYPGGKPVPLWGIYILIGYVLLMAMLTFVALVVLWPPIRSEGKAEAQKILEGGTPTAVQNQGAGTAIPTLSAPGASPGQGTTTTPQGATPAQNAPPAPGTTAQGGAATPAAAQAAAQATPHPALVALLNEPDEHKRIFNGYCVDMYGKPREGVSPLKIPFVASLGLRVASPRCVYGEDRLLLIVLFAGALGGLGHALRSLGWYIGNRRLKWSWSALYFLTPFMSAAIALVFYFVIRGGFFSPTSSVSDTSPFGFAAVAALIGMFTEEAINKLRNVASTLLTPKEQGEDHFEPKPAPVVGSISPPSGPTSGGTEVSIVGDNFQPGVAVAFGGVAATVVSAEAKLVRLKTPAHAAGQVDVVLTNTDKQSQVSANGFEYKDDAPPGGQPAQAPGQQGQEGQPQQPARNVAGPPPTISAIQPAAVDKAGGERLTITGTNFVEGATVTLGGREAAGVAVVDAETISLPAPASDAEGEVAVVVTNPGGASSPAAGLTYASVEIGD
jgi:hypothetical protein